MMADFSMWNLFLKGKAEAIKEYLEEHPSFNVNANLPGYSYGPLHAACIGGNTKVVELLVAHLQINVNQKDGVFGYTPLSVTCRNGLVEVVKVLLKDSRVDINMPDNGGCTPLWCASFNGHIEVIKWIIASGREINLDLKGNYGMIEYAIIEAARSRYNTKVVSLLKRFIENQAQTRHEIRTELGLVDKDAAELFATTVFLCDDYLKIRETGSKVEVVSFFKIVSRLPMELQMIICRRVYDSSKDNIKSSVSEPAFRLLAKMFA